MSFINRHIYTMSPQHSFLTKCRRGWKRGVPHNPSQLSSEASGIFGRFSPVHLQINSVFIRSTNILRPNTEIFHDDKCQCNSSKRRVFLALLRGFRRAERLWRYPAALVPSEIKANSCITWKMNEAAE